MKPNVSAGAAARARPSARVNANNSERRPVALSILGAGIRPVRQPR
jgi:hypothetical protein